MCLGGVVTLIIAGYFANAYIGTVRFLADADGPLLLWRRLVHDHRAVMAEVWPAGLRASGMQGARLWCRQSRQDQPAGAGADRRWLELHQARSICRRDDPGDAVPGVLSRSSPSTIGYRMIGLILADPVKQSSAGLGEFVDRVDELVAVMVVERDRHCEHAALGKPDAARTARQRRT
jgi:hypothetical protein